jgi:hypothetical protein
MKDEITAVDEKEMIVVGKADFLISTSSGMGSQHNETA